MLKGISWKYYLIFVGIAIIISAFFDYRIVIGIVLGTINYFLNLRIAENKFPRLDSKARALTSALLVMALQGLITILVAILAWIIGKLPCFLAVFAAMVIPNIYFFIVGSRYDNNNK